MAEQWKKKLAKALWNAKSPQDVQASNPEVELAGVLDD